MAKTNRGLVVGSAIAIALLLFGGWWIFRRPVIVDSSSTLSQAETAQFFATVGQGSLAEVRRAVQRNPDLLKARDSIRATPLHRAVEKGDVEMVTALLQMGAPTNVRDANYDSTPLAWAVSWGRPKVVEVLLVHGAKVEPGMDETAHRGELGENNWSPEPKESYVAVRELLKKYSSKQRV